MDSTALQLVSEALWVTTKVVAPLLIMSLIVGVVISLFQAIFQIQDQSLSLVPKLLLSAGLIAVTGPWALRQLVEFFQHALSSIPQLLGHG